MGRGPSGRNPLGWKPLQAEGHRKSYVGPGDSGGDTCSLGGTSGTLGQCSDRLYLADHTIGKLPFSSHCPFSVYQIDCCGGGLVAELCLTLTTPWTLACQAPQSMGLSRRKYQSGLPSPSLGDLPDPGMKPGSPAWQVDSLLLSHQGSIWLGLLLLLLLLSCFSRVWLCATPETAAHQAPLSLAFSRQEHWSGLPFPSPMHQSEKWKWSRSVVSDSWQPHGLQPTRLLHPWDFPGKSTGVGCHRLLRTGATSPLTHTQCLPTSIFTLSPGDRLRQQQLARI